MLAAPFCFLITHNEFCASFAGGFYESLCDGLGYTPCGGDGPTHGPKGPVGATGIVAVAGNKYSTLYAALQTESESQTVNYDCFGGRMNSSAEAVHQCKKRHVLHTGTPFLGEEMFLLRTGDCMLMRSAPTNENGGIDDKDVLASIHKKLPDYLGGLYECTAPPGGCTCKLMIEGYGMDPRGCLC